MAGVYERPDGVTDAEWKEFLRDVEEAEDALATLTCPDCGNALIKKLIPETTQEPDSWGMWFSYTCEEDCGFSVDQREGN